MCESLDVRPPFRVSKRVLKVLLRSLIDGGKPVDGCLEWRFGRTSNGYGIITIPGHGTQMVHRLAWYFYTGSWPEKLICHSCDNPPCFRKEHLWEGTHKENTHDMVAKGRHGGWSKRHKP
jgi:hypothetical protein